jgi:hypothetical protein
VLDALAPLPEAAGGFGPVKRNDLMDYERQQNPISKMEGDKDGGGFEENNSKDNTPKKDRLEGYSNLNKKLDALDEKSKGKFLEEFKDEDFAKFEKNTDLVSRWKELDDLTTSGDTAFVQLKKDTAFLQQFDAITKKVLLNDHIFKGHVKKKTKPDGTEYWEASGVHSEIAINNGNAAYKGNQTPVGPSGLGYFKSKIKLHDPSFPQNEGWKSKSKPSTFFPNSWSREKIQAEITLVLKKNKIPIQTTSDGRKLYGGTMSDGVQLRIWEATDGTFESAYPLL